MSGPAAAACPSTKSSRLCIKNLPKHITDQRFRDAFAAIGDVTDVKILKTQSGRARQIGFVGFRTVQDAVKAKAHFDRTFLDTSRIAVEYALPVGDTKLSRPWSRHSKGSSSHQKANPHLYPKPEREETPPEKFPTELDRVEHDGKFQEFLSAMKPRRKGKFWDNDDVAVVPNKKPGGQGLFVKKVHKRFDAGAEEQPCFDESDDDDDNDDAFENPGVDVADAAACESELSPSDDESDGLEAPLPQGGGRRPGLDAPPEGNGLEAPLPQGRGRRPDLEAPPEAKPCNVNDGDVPDVCDTARIFIRNLSFAVTEDDLAAAFRPFGDIIEVNVPVDDVGRSKGFAMIQFGNGASALRAMSKMDGQVFQGRLLHCLPGRAKPEPVKTESSTHKGKVAAQRKALASSSANWNSLFVNLDTAVAGQSVDKSALVGPDASNAAVNVALAETNVIAQTKEWLNEAGVNIDVFDGLREKRSSNVILVKNVPFDCTEDEIRDLFQKHGQVARCVLPPTRALALVEMSSNPTARRAFAALAYAKFHHLPLYLEWAPENVFGDVEARPANNSDGQVAELDEEDGDPVMQATIFVKNLNFATTEDGLRALFKPYAVRSVRIAARKTSAGKTLSRGYGFVEFASRDMAMDVLKKMQGVELDEHRLALSMSNNQKSHRTEKQAKRSEAISESKLSQTKLIVKNVPFEASIKELRDLFQTFGTVKSCRIPNKFAGGHRGFAFVEFATASGAQVAKKALEATHFYGRHLVISYAKKDESLDELREKAAEQSAGVLDRKRNSAVVSDDDDDEFGTRSKPKRRLK